MPAAARLGDPISCGDTVGQGSGDVFINGLPATRTMSDLTVGHCFRPTYIISSSPTVSANDKEIALVGDIIYEPDHWCKKTSNKHPGTIINGSPDVIFGQSSGTPASQISITPEDAQDVVEDPANVATRQATVDAYEAAVHDADDEGAPTPEGEEVPLSAKGQGYIAAAVKDNNVRTNPSQPIDIVTPPAVVLNDNPDLGPTNPATIPAKTGVQTSGYTYDDIEAVTGSFPGSFQLSPNFTLSAVTTGCTVSNYSVRGQTVAGVNYTAKDVVKNLRDLCYNILEPLKTLYPSFSVNSGFRHTINGKSQHERGQAVDIAFPGLATDATAAFARAQEIASSTLPFDQFIFEQNRTIWFHLSYSKTSQRRDVRTKPKGVDTPRPGLVKVS
jgi:hypothetical protein